MVLSMIAVISSSIWGAFMFAANGLLQYLFRFQSSEWSSVVTRHSFLRGLSFLASIATLVLLITSIAAYAHADARKREVVLGQKKFSPLPEYLLEGYDLLLLEKEVNTNEWNYEYPTLKKVLRASGRGVDVLAQASSLDKEDRDGEIFIDSLLSKCDSSLENIYKKIFFGIIIRNIFIDDFGDEGLFARLRRVLPGFPPQDHKIYLSLSIDGKTIEDDRVVTIRDPSSTILYLLDNNFPVRSIKKSWLSIEEGYPVEYSCQIGNLSSGIDAFEVRKDGSLIPKRNTKIEMKIYRIYDEDHLVINSFDLTNGILLEYPDKISGEKRSRRDSVEIVGIVNENSIVNRISSPPLSYLDLSLSGIEDVLKDLKKDLKRWLENRNIIELLNMGYYSIRDIDDLEKIFSAYTEYKVKFEITSQYINEDDSTEIIVKYKRIDTLNDKILDPVDEELLVKKRSDGKVIIAEKKSLNLSR